MKRKPLSFEERLFAMTRNLLEYGNYGKSIDKAAKRLHSYYPDTTLEFCEKQFYQTVEVYEAAIDFVEQNKDEYWQEYKKGNYFHSHCVSDKEGEWIKKFGGVPESLIKDIIGWIFFWHHLK